jgi:hypothetical protein
MLLQLHPLFSSVYLATLLVRPTVSVPDIKKYDYGVLVEFFQLQPKVQARQEHREELTYVLFTRPMKTEQTVYRNVGT